MSRNATIELTAEEIDTLAALVNTLDWLSLPEEAHTLCSDVYRMLRVPAPPYKGARVNDPTVTELNYPFVTEPTELSETMTGFGGQQ